VLDLGNPSTQASHFFGVEGAADRHFRWSREMSAVSLPALASSVNISVTLDPARPDGQELPTVLLSVGDNTIAALQTTPGWQQYGANLGPGFSPDVRLVVESGTFFPGAGDRRLLGVAISQIGVRPAPNRFGMTFPPLLWLALASAAPGLCLGALQLLGRAGAKLALQLFLPLSALLPVAASLVIHITFGLPFFAWFVGLCAATLMVLYVARSLGAGSTATRWLQRLMQSRWELPAVGSLAAVLAVGATWPLATRLPDSLPGWPADNFAFLYKLWWFRTALLEEHRSPFFDPGSYAPFGFNLGQGEPTLTNTVPAVLIGGLTSDVVAYNLLALGSFVVSAVGAYLLGRELTRSRLAAFLSALSFAFCPYRLSQFAGHLQLLGTDWIALSFYFLERLLRTRRAREGVWLGLSYGLAALSAWYYAYMVGLALGVYLLARLATGGWTAHLRAAWRGLVAGMIVFLVLTSPVAIPSLELWAEGSLTHSAKAADEHSAAPTDYVAPNPLQPVWGEVGMRYRAEQNVIESALYVGSVIAIVIAVGWAWLRRRADAKERRIWSAWLALALIAAVLSLGLTLHDANGQVRIGQGGAIALPGQLLYDWLPLYSSMRAFARFGVIVALALAALLGLVWNALVRYGPTVLRRNRAFATALLVSLLMCDFWSGPYAWGTSRVEAGATARFLAEQPAGIVMEMPLESSQSGPALYLRVNSGKPVAYGYETFEPAQWRAQRPALEDFPQERALAVMRDWGVRYLVVSGKSYGADWPEMLDYLKSLPRLRFRAYFEERSPWRVDPQVLDARPDMVEYSIPDRNAVFELLP
ncbi:MAG: glycosyltransferase family 39 protein, partial [Chloroflexota bacterium]|nr:glycosyltransferase family 39 protein [Chloroflexota bacterium]